MVDKKVYTPKWTYDVWDDIENCFPRGNFIDCSVIYVDKWYAFLKGPSGVDCYLSKAKVAQRWVVNDLTEEVKKGDKLTCKVIDYNFEKKSVNVSLNLIN